jgi:hypothetical protein
MVINPDGTVQFEGDVSKLAPRGGVSAASDLAAQNRAGRVGKYGAEGVAKMETAGARFGGPTTPAAAPSVGTPTNPAPVATAAAATTPGFGARALRALRLGGRALGIGAGVAQAGYGAKQLAEGDLGGVENMALGGATAVHPAIGLAGNALAAGRDVAMKTIIDRMFGNSGNFIPQKPGTGVGAATAPAAATSLAPGVNAYPSVAAAPKEAQSLLNGNLPVPALGTGAAMNTNTGRALTFNTGIPAAATPGGGETISAQPAAPVLGTKGGIFENLAAFTNETAKQKLATAQQGREFNRSVKLGTLGASQQRAEAASTAATGRLLTGVAAAQNVGLAGKKALTDLTGNPVIVDTRAGTAVKPVVKQQLSEADITGMMSKYNKTRAQVLKDAVEKGFAAP